MSLDLKAIEQRLREEAARRVLAAAITLQSAHRGDLSVGNPSPHDHPAPHGQFPRLRTGGLRANVAIEPASVAGVIAKGSCSVGYRPGGMHGAYLAGKGWKGLLDTFNRERPKLLTILAAWGATNASE